MCKGLTIALNWNRPQSARIHTRREQFCIGGEMDLNRDFGDPTVIKHSEKERLKLSQPTVQKQIKDLGPDPERC